MRRLAAFLMGFVPRILLPLGGIPGYDSLSIVSPSGLVFPPYELRIPVLDAAVKALSLASGLSPALVLSLIVSVASGLLMVEIVDAVGGVLPAGLALSGALLAVTFVPKYAVGLLLILLLIRSKDPLARAAYLTMLIPLHHVSFYLGLGALLPLMLKEYSESVSSWKRLSPRFYLPLLPAAAGIAYYVAAGVRFYWAGLLPDFALLLSFYVVSLVGYLYLVDRWRPLDPAPISILLLLPFAFFASWAEDSLPAGLLTVLAGVPIALGLFSYLGRGKGGKEAASLAVPALSLLGYGLLKGIPVMWIAANRAVPLLLVASILSFPIMGKKYRAILVAASVIAPATAGVLLYPAAGGRVQFVGQQDMAAAEYACSLNFTVISDDHFFKVVQRTCNCSVRETIFIYSSSMPPPRRLIIFSSRMIEFVTVEGSYPYQLPPDWEERAVSQLDTVYVSHGEKEILIFLS